MILRGSAQHRRAADIDVLDRVVERALDSRHGLLKWIQVDDENFDRIDRMLGQRARVFSLGSIGQQAGMDARIQRLHAPIEYLWKAGVLRDLGNFDPALAQQLCSSAGRQNVKAKGAQLLSKIRDTGFVGNAQQRPPAAGLRHESALISALITIDTAATSFATCCD